MRNVEKEWEKINNDFIADEDLEQYNFDEGVQMNLLPKAYQYGL